MDKYISYWNEYYITNKMNELNLSMFTYTDHRNNTESKSKLWGIFTSTQIFLIYTKHNYIIYRYIKIVEV